MIHAGDYGISDGAKMSNITSLSLPFLHVKDGLYQNKDSGSLISLWSISVLNTLLNHRSTSAPVNLLLLRISAEVFWSYSQECLLTRCVGRTLLGSLMEGWTRVMKPYGYFSITFWALKMIRLCYSDINYGPAPSSQAWFYTTKETLAMAAAIHLAWT